MKKQLFLFSALALAALTGCGSKGNLPYTAGTPIKVGLICLHDTTSTYDKNFIDAFEAACNKAKEEGIVSSYQIKTDVLEEGRDCYNAAEQFVNQGCNVIFSDSFGHDVSIHEAAEKFNNVQFSSATGIEARKSGLNNFHNAFASIYEGRYLAGIAGAQALIEKGTKPEDAVKLGYVGAWPYAEVISGYTSWFLGVKSLLPNATMEVKYTNSWYNQALEETAAKTLIDNGAVLVSQHADSMGAPGACVEKKVLNVSYNMNTAEMNEKCKDTYVAHSRINWQPYYYNFLKSVFDGKPLDGENEKNWTGTLETKSVEYNVSSELVKDKTHITAAENALKNGTLKVFDCSKFTVKDLAKKYDEGKAPVKGKDYDCDADGHLTSFKGATDMYDRDQELVEKDGKGTKYIKESTYRSAPSFDLIIDGITKI